MTASLEIDRIDAGYGRIQVLKAVSLQVGEGEAVALIGSNGAGKTTLMRTISGLIRPMAGTIRLGGQPLSSSPDRVVAAGVSLVPEGRRVFAPLTVIDNLTLGAYGRLRVGDRAAVARDLDQVFATFPRLRERSGQIAGTLSGGEQQMLAIGRALMARPRVLLLDEPSMGLAPLVVEEIFRVVQQMHHAGMTILLAEQNARMALKVAQRGYLIENGSIVGTDTAEALRNDPEVRRVYLGL
jgi:branched-chain amino acid transport system ATP-binding protein